MAVESPAFANQAKTYSAEQTRRAVFLALARTTSNSPGILNGGTLSASDLQLSAPGSGLSVNVSTGEAVTPGNEGGAQGGYYGRGSSTTNLVISAANPSNPRIDTVCATVSDTGYTEPTGGSGDQWALQVVTGTPTVGATLANLLGVATLPGSSLLLGYVLVPAAAANIITADIANSASLVTSGLPSLTCTLAPSNTTAVSGQWMEASPGVTVTLPAPVRNSIVAVAAGGSVTGASPVTVHAGASGALFGGGVTNAVSLTLGQPGSSVTLVADGSNWVVIAGQQDSGWVALTLATNITAGTGYTPSARLIGDRVWLKGAPVNGTGGAVASGGSIATVPAGLRPGVTVSLEPVYSALGVASQAWAQLTSAGALTFNSGGATWTSAASADFTDVSFSLS